MWSVCSIVCNVVVAADDSLEKVDVCSHVDIALWFRGITHVRILILKLGTLDKFKMIRCEIKELSTTVDVEEVILIEFLFGELFNILS